VNQKIVLFGLGTMGAGMASNLLRAGFSLTVYSRTAAKAHPRIGAGARPAFSPAEADRGAAVLVSMFADGAASREFWRGENGALAAVAPGAILMESRTVNPGWITQLAALAASQSVESIDPPVTGSRVQPETGQLYFPVGGMEGSLLAATPALQTLNASYQGNEQRHRASRRCRQRRKKVKLINKFSCGAGSKPRFP
jgi:3-hydroxyisobutyrate dehydrogenase